jgi:putative ABC transport system permease protein
MLAFLAGTWKQILPGRPFEYSFFDEDVAKMYASERRTGRMFGAGALISLFIAALGLFGLASYSAAKRTKEIGIRKTLGASVRDVTLLLSREFTGLFLLANILAWPVAYFLSNQWLRGFAYRIAASPGIFLLASAAAFLVLIISVGSQAVKAALADPVDSLRYE